MFIKILKLKKKKKLKGSTLRNSDSLSVGREGSNLGKKIRRAIKWCFATLPRRIVSTLVIAGLVFGIVYSVFFAREAKAAWWNDDWAYRQKIQLTNSTGADLTDFQVSTVVDTATLITNGKMIASTCADMRFTDLRGQPLDYWIEENNPGCGNAATKVWIKVPKVYNGTNATSIYMYYGNPSSSASQSGDKTFQFFDDFNGISLNTNKWTQHTGEAVGSGAVIIDVSSGSPAGSEDYIYAAGTNITLGSVIEMRNKSAATNQVHRFGLTDQRTTFYSGANYIGFQKWLDSNLYTDTNNGGNPTQTSEKTYDTNWHNYRMFWTTNSAKYYEDSSLLREYVANVPDGADNLHPLIRDQGQTDYIFTHKYASTEPTTSASAEERGPGPAAYWRFDDPASTPPGGTAGQAVRDSTSNRNDGILGTTVNVDSADPTWKPESECVAGKCLDYDGTDDVATVTQSSSINLTGKTGYTISAWIKADGAGENNTGEIIDKGANTYLRVDNPSGSNLDIEGQIDLGTTPANLNISAGVTTNKWYHIALVYEDDGDDEISIYINGVSKGTSSGGSGSLATETNNLLIGGDSSNNFNGSIDEVKIYPYARTADQIKQDYNAGKSAQSAPSGSSAALGGELPKWMTDGLVGHWKMDESSGTSVADASGNGNTGTLTNAQETGTADAESTQTTLVDADNVNLSSTNDAYNNMILSITGGGGCAIGAQERLILDYDGAAKTFTVPPFWNNVADNCAYQIYHQSLGKFANGLGFGGDNDYVAVGNINQNAGSISFWLKAGSTTQKIIDLDGGTHTIESSSGVLQANNFSSPVIYVDGKQTTALSDTNWHFIAVTTSAPFSASNVNLGKVSSDYLRGALDDARVYNRALSPDEVRALSEWGPGPIQYYKFDEGSGSNAYDSSGNGLNGSWTGSAEHYAQGKFGDAARFNGTANYVTLPGNSLTTQNAYTVETWVKPRNKTSYPYWNFFAQNIKGAGYFSAGNSGVAGKLITMTSYNGSSNYWAESNSALQDDVWSHAAFVIERGVGYKFYINGKLDRTYSEPTINLSDSITAGYLGKWSTSYFNGLLDEFKIYNYARTPKQITEDMNAGHPIGGSPVGSPVAHYKLDEGYGTSSQDASQNNQDLTLVNTPAWSTGGKFGRALDFEKDSSEYGRAADSSGLSITSDLTVSAWIKPESTTAATLFDIAGKWDYSGSAKESYLLAQYGSELRMYIDSASNYKTTSGLGLTAGTWYHVAATYSASAQTVTLYVNGADKGGSVTGTIPASIGDDTDRFHVGAEDSQGTAANFYDGLIDEVKIYNSALTPEQIAIDMNQGKSLRLGSQTSATGATGQAAEYCVPGDSTSCAAPVAEWKFDEKTGGSVNDTSGNSNTGTWYGTGTHWTRGKYGSAGSFNGTNDYVQVADSPSFTLTNGYTVSGWMKTSATTGTREVIGQWGTGGAGNAAWALYQEAGGYISLYNHDGSVTSSLVDNTTSLSTGQWYYVAGVYDGGTTGTNAHIYINGKLVKEGTISRAPQDSSNAWVGLGRAAAMGLNLYFSGYMDEMKIFSYARTPAQIAWDYNRGKPVGHWKLDEGEGDKAYDSSGNGNTGTLTQMDPPNDWVTGKFGKALDFDGGNDYVGVGNTGKSVNSVSLWVKPNSTSQSIIDLDGGTHTITVSSGTISANNFSGATIYVDGRQTNILPDTNWHLITATTATSFTASSLSIGKVNSNYFQGQIDDVRIYNYALTQTQIQQVMNEGSAVRFGE